MQWIGTWIHSHIFTTTHISPDLGEEVEEILGDVSAQMMLVHYGWGCVTFQSATHMHFIHIQGVWVPSHVVDRHMYSHIVTTTNIPPDVGKLAQILGEDVIDWSLPLQNGWGSVIFQTVSHIYQKRI